MSAVTTTVRSSPRYGATPIEASHTRTTRRPFLVSTACTLPAAVKVLAGCHQEMWSGATTPDAANAGAQTASATTTTASTTSAFFMFSSFYSGTRCGDSLSGQRNVGGAAKPSGGRARRDRHRSDC